MPAKRSCGRKQKQSPTRRGCGRWWFKRFPRPDAQVEWKCDGVVDHTEEYIERAWKRGTFGPIEDWHARMRGCPSFDAPSVAELGPVRFSQRLIGYATPHGRGVAARAPDGKTIGIFGDRGAALIAVYADARATGRIWERVAEPKEPGPRRAAISKPEELAAGDVVTEWTQLERPPDLKADYFGREENEARGLNREPSSRFPLARGQTAFLDDAKEELSLIARAQGGDLLAQERLITSHARFIIKAAMQFRGYANSSDFLDDLVAEAMRGFLRAIRRFDPTRGFRLATFARKHVKGACLTFIEKDSIVKKPRELFWQGNKPIETNAPPVKRDRERRTFDHEALSTVVSGFDARQLRILYDRLLSDEPMKLKELGSELGITMQGVQQSKKRILDKLSSCVQTLQ